jgi:putative phosphoribosyl transferase
MYVQPLFRNREEAGDRLGDRLGRIVPDPSAIVLALPRGGVPVAFQVARILGSELDLLLVRKLGVPGHEELAMGAIASGGTRVLNDGVIAHLGIPPAVVERVSASERTEIDRRERVYRGSRPQPQVYGRTVILVDDGLATGATMTAAVRAMQTRQPKRVIAAIPVGAADAVEDLREHADEVVCLANPEPFYAVGLWYEDFAPTTDAQVRELLDRALQEHAA